MEGPHHTLETATVAPFRAWRGSRASVGRATSPTCIARRGGGGGIRTLGTLLHTRFPIVHLRPLGHPSGGSPPNSRERKIVIVVNLGGERGIRTHGTVTGTFDFESNAFDRSASSPRRKLAPPPEGSTEFSRLRQEGLSAAGDEPEWPRRSPSAPARIPRRERRRRRPPGGSSGRRRRCGRGSRRPPPSDRPPPRPPEVPGR